jgi:uncharacterized protein (DUF2141 family)
MKNNRKINKMKTKVLKTITGSLIKVTPNNRSKTFTIRTNGAKYRTLQMSREEFESAKAWTGNDWSQFLKTDEYYVVR